MKLFLSPTIHKIRSFLLPTLPFSRHKATKKAPRVISVPLMSGVLRCSNVAFYALLHIPYSRLRYIQKRAVVHFLASYAASTFPLTVKKRMSE